MLRGLLAAVVLAALLVGLPWALTHFVGWPLPEHLPSWAEIEGVLLGPMTATFLLDFLACASWLVWALFTVDVACCAVDIARDARMPELSATEPVRRVAAVLVGAVLISILGHRVGLAPASPLSSWPGTGSEVVATAPAWTDPAVQGAGDVRLAAYTAPHRTAATAAEQSVPATSVVVLAPDPHTGVHDCLWRIAERTLGDGHRWPEIFELNKGKPQPGGGTFTRPSLIFPGEEFALPAGATEPTRPAPPPQDPPTPTPSTPAPITPPTTSAPPSGTSAPSTAPPTTVSPSTPATTPTPQQPMGTDSRPTLAWEPGIAWGVELFVGVGLAAAVSTALLLARRRYRARYRPGSGDRDDLPVAPVVYRLHLAHLRADDEVDPDDHWDSSSRDDGDGGDGDGDLVNAERPRRVPPPPAVVVGTARTRRDGRRTPVAAGLGVRDGREIALDLAAARGLGLIGAGAPAAARALLLAALTTTGRPAGSGAAGVVVPAEDLAAVLGHRAAHAPLPTAVRVVADLDAALDALEAETLVRAADRDQAPCPPLVLLARPPRQHRRLHAVLDNGAPFGVTGLLLGHWQPGVTCYVRDDGTISATGPGLGEALRGTRMFRLGDDDTADLLTLLHHAEPEPPTNNDNNGDGGDVHAFVSPMARSRTVPTTPGARPPDKTARRGGDRGGSAPPGESVPDTELEVTAAVEAAPHAETELEILGPSSPPTPGARLRPRAAPSPPPESAPAAATDSASEGAEDGVALGHTEGERALITISVLGGLRVHWHPDTGGHAPGREITGALQPRTQGLLVLLALHPDGATRDTLVEALWGQDPPGRPTNALHTALSRLRRDLAQATDGAAAEIAAVDNGRYRLDPTRVRVDYWRFAAAVAARRAASTHEERVAAYREIIDNYGGRVADGLSKIDWIEPAREAIRRDAIDAVSGLARALVDHDPQQTLNLLEVARAFDPHNESLYRDIMRLQGRLGHLDAIPRTLTLLTTRLTEVNETPTPEARGLAERLGLRHDTDRPDRPTGPARPADRGERGRST